MAACTYPFGRGGDFFDIPDAAPHRAAGKPRTVHYGLAERLAEVKFRTRLSGSNATRGARVTVFFDDREAQTILYCMEDGTLWLTVGNRKYCGKDAALYGRLRELAEKGE